MQVNLAKRPNKGGDGPVSAEPSPKPPGTPGVRDRPDRCQNKQKQQQHRTACRIDAASYREAPNLCSLYVLVNREWQTLIRRSLPEPNSRDAEALAAPRRKRSLARLGST